MPEFFRPFAKGVSQISSLGWEDTEITAFDLTSGKEVDAGIPNAEAFIVLPTNQDPWFPDTLTRIIVKSDVDEWGVITPYEFPNCGGCKLLDLASAKASFIGIRLSRIDQWKIRDFLKRNPPL